MKYLYYPGCSLKGTAREYNISTISLMNTLGAELFEIENYSCCGASAAESVSDLLSYVLPARNLAIAEKMNSESENNNMDILVPCSACYLNLKKVSIDVKTDPKLLADINTALSQEGLEFKNLLNIRHILDVLKNDFDINTFQNKIKLFFNDFTIAPYYGCQCLRPYHVFDNPEKPDSMEPFIKAAKAEVFAWEMGSKCCGAAHMNTKPELGQTLVKNILKAGKDADMILTVCPMCQMNLEAFQDQISKKSNEKFDISIVYLTQFITMAMGMDDKDTRLDLNLSITKDFKKKYLNLKNNAALNREN